MKKELYRMLAAVLIVILLCSTYIVTKDDDSSLRLQNYLLPDRRLGPPDQYCNSTVISAYYHIHSKHSHEKYLSWMINFLTLKDCLVVFVQPDLVDTIHALRPPAYPTIVIPRPLSSFHVNRAVSPEKWRRQEKLDPERQVGHSDKLYQIWNEKSNMIKLVADINPFDSQYFVWLDIGAIRHTLYNHQLLVQRVPTEPGVLLLNVDDFTKEERQLRGGEASADFTSVDRIGGGTIGCDLESCYRWHSTYYSVMQRMVERERFIGKDQSVMASVCVETEMCLLVKSDREHWFKLQEWFRRDINTKYQRLNKI